jgi:DNA-binding protein H-NS
MSSLIEIQVQIEKLQKQANDIKTREFDKTVLDIRAKMSAFGITLKDLQPGKSTKSGKRAAKAGATGATRIPGRAKSKSAGAAVAAKYRGPNGETWTGRGLMPRWLAALVSQGQTRDDFLIPS